MNSFLKRNMPRIRRNTEQFKKPIVQWNPKKPKPYYLNYGFDREERALDMIRNQRKIVQPYSKLSLVQSQRINEVYYKTTFDSCNCNDFVKNQGQIHCKHILFKRMHSKL